MQASQVPPLDHVSDLKPHIHPIPCPQTNLRTHTSLPQLPCLHTKADRKWHDLLPTKISEKPCGHSSPVVDISMSTAQLMESPEMWQDCADLSFEMFVPISMKHSKLSPPPISFQGLDWTFPRHVLSQPSVYITRKSWWGREGEAEAISLWAGHCWSVPTSPMDACVEHTARDVLLWVPLPWIFEHY